MRILKYKKTNLIVLFLIILLIFASATLIGDETNTTISFNPSNQTVGKEVSFSVDVYCFPSEPIKAYEITILFNASVLQAQSVTEGDIFDEFSTFFNPGIINNGKGNISQIYGLIVGNGNTTDPGTLVSINFITQDINASSFLKLINVGITNETTYISVTFNDGYVQVDATAPSVLDNSPEQGFTGDSFLFNATITDNIDSPENLIVKVDWSHGSNSGNVSMNYMGGNYFTKTVTLDLTSVSDLSYKIYVIDSYGNSYTTPTVLIPVDDNDSPAISSVSASPTPQSIGGYVNISADVTDNIAVNEVFLNIIYPNSFNENFSITANQTGNTYFCNKIYNTVGTYTYNIWANDNSNYYTISGNYNFQIRDITHPIISNINITTSNPLDTNPSFGWINISCEVTDNTGVNEVYLNNTKPDNSYKNSSMSSSGNDIYFYNSSIDFSTCGNYTYYVWANDTNDNSVISNIYVFFMPPNWDINKDGSCTVLDLILISNYYGYKNSPGWIREDVDNNGTIEVIDLVFVSNHHGEFWWE